MALDRKAFFDAVRVKPFGGALTPGQVDGLNRILDEWERRGLTDLRWLANILAQSYHESAHKMQPVREMGGEAYLRSKRYYPWVGEGLIQVTWEANHRKFGATAPGQLLTWPIALKALFDGMVKGMFTGKKLADYFNAKKDDPVGARRIVNGTDRAALIAGYHKMFLAALHASGAKHVPAPAPKSAIPAVAVGTAVATGGVIAATTGSSDGTSWWAIAGFAGASIALGLIVVFVIQKMRSTGQ